MQLGTGPKLAAVNMTNTCGRHAMLAGISWWTDRIGRPDIAADMARQRAEWR